MRRRLVRRGRLETGPKDVRSGESGDVALSWPPNPLERGEPMHLVRTVRRVLARVTALAVVALCIAPLACSDGPTEPVRLSESYGLVSFDGRPLPAITDTTEVGEIRLTSGTLTFDLGALDPDVPSAVRSFTFASTGEFGGVPNWISEMQIATGVRRSGRLVIFMTFLIPDGPGTPMDTGRVDAQGRLILSGYPFGPPQFSARHELVFEPADPADDGP